MTGESFVELSCEPKGPDFYISSDCMMPEVTVIATVRGVPAEAAAHLSYAWSWKLEFDGNNGRVGSVRLRTQHDAPRPQTGPHDRFKLPFEQIRGGALTVAVRVTGGKLNLTATSVKWRVLGTNPTLAQLAVQAPPVKRFRQMLRAESTGNQGPRQFLDSGFPLLNEQRRKAGLVTDGGVGLCQITKYPGPTPDDVWSWKANLASAATKWRKNMAASRQIPKKFRASAIWASMVTAYNQSPGVRLPQLERMATAEQAGTFMQLGANIGAWPPASASSLPPIPLDAVKLNPVEIELPEFSRDQLEREALRLYNGRVVRALYEHRPRIDRTGILIVSRRPGADRAVAEWEQVPAADRKKVYEAAGIPGGKWGDPDYVNHVERQPAF